MIQAKVFTFMFDQDHGGFACPQLDEFQRNHVVLEIREHFFTWCGRPHLSCLVVFDDETAPMPVRAWHQHPPQAVEPNTAQLARATPPTDHASSAKLHIDDAFFGSFTAG